MLSNYNIKGERNQLLIWGFLQNLELIKKKWKYDVFNDNFTRADAKARLYLIDFKFLSKHAGCHFSFISDVTPSIPTYLFSFCIKTILSFLEFRHNGQKSEGLYVKFVSELPEFMHT